MSQNPAAPYLERRQRNLEFLRRNYPGLYRYFKDYKLRKLRLDIQTETAEVDLIVGDRRVYDSRGYAYARHEAGIFDTSFAPGSSIQSVPVAMGGEYDHPRYFAHRLRRTYQESPLGQATDRFCVPDFLPFVVCLGVGLGQHIAELQRRRQIHHLLVVEHDPDRFAASLYTAEWWKIVNTQRERSGHTIDFLMLHNVKSLKEIQATIWNRLVDRCPIFPINTFFYNHRGDADYNTIVDQINRDMYVHLLSFGNYDDEVNQLNNMLHNFRKPIPRSGRVSARQLAAGGRSAVCIVGSGPSLDQRIEDLKQLQSKAVVISAGTALGALLAHGVTPDIHVELESDYTTALLQSQSAHADQFSGLRLLGAAQLSPRLFELFGQCRLYFKAESPMARFFAEPQERVANAAPTCTNAALALAFHNDFSDLFLFGLDYGFPDSEQHHARGTLYYEPDSEAFEAAREPKRLIRTEAADGGEISTTPFLFSSRRRTENLLVWGAQNRRVFNFSDGARIEGATWRPRGEVADLLAELVDVRQTVVEGIFSSDQRAVDREVVQRRLDKAEEFLRDFCERLRKYTDVPLHDLADLTRMVWRINHYLHHTLRTQSESYYYFVRGSVWHFLYAVYGHAFALKEDAQRVQWMQAWQQHFLAFLADWPLHFQMIVRRAEGEPDPLVDRSIHQPEPILDSGVWTVTPASYNPETGFVLNRQTTGVPA